jgi:ribosomal protein S18 acetylase RimI-like enzyme
MFNIRPAKPSEAPLIVDFQLHMALESEGVQLDRETLTAGVAAVFDEHTQASYWIAEEESRVVGMLMTMPEWSDWRNGTVLWIHSVYVMHQARRRGVFRSMYDHLHRMIRESDKLVGLRLYVDKSNKDAQSVYQTMGMTREHYDLYEWLK